MNELQTLLASMTPAERSTYDTVQRAVAADVLTARERATINQRIGDAAWVNDLRRRITAQKSANVLRMQ